MAVLVSELFSLLFKCPFPLVSLHICLFVQRPPWLTLSLHTSWTLSREHLLLSPIFHKTVRGCQMTQIKTHLYQNDRKSKVFFHKEKLCRKTRSQMLKSKKLAAFEPRFYRCMQRLSPNWKGFPVKNFRFLKSLKPRREVWMGACINWVGASSSQTNIKVIISDKH